MIFYSDSALIDYSLQNMAEFSAKEKGPSCLFAGPLCHIGLLESLCWETDCRIIIMRCAMPSDE